MADASKQLRLVGARDTTGATETYATDRALARGEGGTGVSVSTMAQLRTELSVPEASTVELLANKNATNGYAGLSSGLVAASQLPEFVGAQVAVDGVKGAVPAPLDDNAGLQEYQRFWPLRGDGGWQRRVHLEQLLSHEGSTPVLKIENPNVPQPSDSFGYMRSGEAGTQRWRLGTGANTGLGGDNNVDINLEMTNRGKVLARGDPLQRTLRPSRRIMANAFDGTVACLGLGAAVIASPGAAPLSFDDANGVYCRVTTAAVIDSVASISIPAVITRQLSPDVFVVHRSVHLNARVWIGLFSASPGTFTSLSANSISGMGLYYDDIAHADSLWRIIASTGSAETVTPTTIPVTANARVGLRFRHMGGNTIEGSFFNFTTNAWDERTSSLTNPPATTTVLGFHSVIVALEEPGAPGTATSKTYSISVADIGVAL